MNYGGPPDILKRMKPEYDTIKTRLGKKKWHGMNIQKLVERSFDTALLPGEKSLYETFYKEASSFAHGDSYAVLRHRPSTGWTQAFDPDEQEKWTSEALSLTYQFFTSILLHVQNRCQMGLEPAFQAMVPLLEALRREA